MNLLGLASIISPRLPLELVLVVLSHLPLNDIVRLVQDKSVYFERLLLHHPLFDQRHVYVCLISDPLYSPVIQAHMVPGQPLPPHLMGERVLCLPDADKAQVYFSMIPLTLASFCSGQRLLDFAAGQQGVPTAGAIGVAVLLTHNNLILKRSLHAINPVRTPSFKRSSGHLQFDHFAGVTRVVRCTIGIDWFCC